MSTAGQVTFRFDSLRRALVVAPHPDDEILGCGGIMAGFQAAGVEVHVVFMSVDGFHHYGLDTETTVAERLSEINAVADLFGFTHETLYEGADMIERLDTVPRRVLVDYFEGVFNERRPDVVLLPLGVDYDQDHVATFEAAFAAARPIPTSLGKWMVPHVLTYESPKLVWASQDLPRPTLFVDISKHIETKLRGLRLYASQLRQTPHIRSEESVSALGTLRGKEIGVEHGEAFGVLRTIWAGPSQCK